MNSEIIYANRSRDPSSDYYGTWQSTHSVVYDLEEKVVYLATQESGVYDEFILDIPVYKSGLQAYLMVSKIRCLPKEIIHQNKNLLSEII